MKSLKSFGITFAASLVILGIIALFACGFVADTVCGIFDGSGDLDNMNSADTTASAMGEEDRLNKQLNGQSFTWMMVVSDYRPDVYDNYYPTSPEQAKGLGDFGTLGKDYRFTEATNIIVIRAFVDTREYVILTIPSMSKLEMPSGEYTLGEYYAVGGTEALKEAVEAMTGFTIDYYSVIHSTDLYDLADTVGSIECTIPVNIVKDGAKYTTGAKTPTTVDRKGKKDTKEDTKAPDPTDYELDAADSVFLASKLMPALLYYDPSDGINQEMIIEQSFARGLMNNLSQASDSMLQSMLEALDGVLVSTNLDDDAIYLNGEVIRAFSWFEVHCVTYPGKMVAARGNNDAYYNPGLEEGAGYCYDYR